MGQAQRGDPPPKDRWLWVRLAGWGLIIAYYVLVIVNESLNSAPLRLGGRIVAILGVVLVAWGFERKFRNEQQRNAAKARGGGGV